MIRSFLSLDLPENVKEEIVKIQDIIKKEDLFHGKYTEKENLHLTLKFLGEIDEETVVKVKETLEKVKVNSFEASITQVGVFSPEQVRIVWLKLDDADALQKEIDHFLQDLFPKEQRFMGHITIARVKKVFDKEKLIETLKKINLEKIQKQKIKFDEFFLKKSILTTQGSLYSVIKKYNLN